MKEAQRRGITLQGDRTKLFIDPDPVRWIENHFRIPETKDKHIILAPYQKRAIYEALSQDEKGKLNYSIVIWSDIKKSIKSSIAAAVALWHAWQIDWGQIILIANDLKQADSRVGFYLRRAIELNPDMRDVCKIRNFKVTLPNRTSIESVPIDPTGEAGSNADRIIFCLDDQTEIMTKEGWKGWNELSRSDYILTLNQEKRGFEWQKSNNIYCDDYSGEMYTVENSMMSISVTPEHRLYGIFDDELEPRFEKAKNIFKYEKYSLFTYFDLTYLVTVYKKDWKIIQYSGKVFCPSTDNGIVWVRRNGKIYAQGNSELWGSHAKAQERMWCLDNQTEILTRQGWKNGLALELSDSIQTYNRETHELEWELPKAIYKDWYRGEMHTYETKTFSHCVTPNHRLLGKYHIDLPDVIIRSDDLRNMGLSVTGFYFKKNTIEYEYVPRENWGAVNYDGMIWCPSTENGFFSTKRNGTYCITGNTEMTLSPTKYGKSQRWVETYAGFSGESALLERLYEQGTMDGAPVAWAKTENPVVEAYENKGIGMFCMWNTVPRLPWQTQEYYASEAAILTESEFNRVHRNKWSSSYETFVPYEWWLSCRDIGMPMIEKNQSVIVAMDAAVSSDCFGLIMVSGDGNGIIQVRYARKWTPERGTKLSFEGPEAELRRLIDEYNVIEVAYDPYQLEDMAGRLNRELIAHMYAFNQGQERLISDKSLRDMIQNRKISHSGEPDLAEHIQNANAEVSSGDKGIRIVKKSDSKKIDLVVALSMAVSRATYWSL